MPQTFTPGDVVHVRDDRHGEHCIGVVAAPGRPLWTRVPDGYLPIKIVHGGRCRGGYRPESLTLIPELRSV